MSKLLITNAIEFSIGVAHFLCRNRLLHFIILSFARIYKYIHNEYALRT